MVLAAFLIDHVPGGWPEVTEGGRPLCAVTPEPAGSFEHELRVLTVNLWGVPTPVTEDPSRWRDLPPHLEGYDLVAVQEAFLDENREPLRRLSYPHQLFGSMGYLPFERLGDGLALFSRYPIVEHDRMAFDVCKASDCGSVKGALFARLRIRDDLEVDVFVTHLQADSTGQLATVVRRRQLRHLRSFMARHDQGHPRLVVGDFNTPSETPAYNRMVTDLGVRDAWPEARRTGSKGGLRPGAVPSLGETLSPRNTWRPGGAAERIDYVFLRPGLFHDFDVREAQTRLDEPVNGRHLSDHFGVEVRLAVRTTLERQHSRGSLSTAP